MSSIDDLLNEGKEQQNNGRHDEAIKMFSIAVDFLEESEKGEENRLAAALNDRGFSYVMTGCQNEAYLDNLRALAVAGDGNTKEKARALIDMSYILRKTFNSPQASLGALELALSIHKGQTAVRAKALDFLGRIYVGTDKNDEAIKLYKEAADICCDLFFFSNNPDAIDDKTILRRYGDILHILGRAYSHQGDDNQAYTHQETALEIYHRIDDLQGVINVESNLGIIHFKKGEFAKALEHYQKAAAVRDDTDPTAQPNITVLSLLQAEVYLTQGDEESAEPQLVRFRDGIIENPQNPKVLTTDYNIELWRERFTTVAEMYDSSGLNIEGFEQIKQRFAV